MRNPTSPDLNLIERSRQVVKVTVAKEYLITSTQGAYDRDALTRTHTQYSVSLVQATQTPFDALALH